MDSDLVTCSFTVNRKDYEIFKKMVKARGETVKEHLAGYIKDIVLSHKLANWDNLGTEKEFQYEATYKDFWDMVKDFEVDDDEL